MTNHTIIFLHIPKTGGRSLQNILLRKYAKNEVLVDAHEQKVDLASWPEAEKLKIRYLQGHFIFGAHEMLPQKCSYITMLREPVDRVISHYYFLKRTPSHPLHRVLEDQNMDLETYVRSGVCDEVNNDQARLVAGFARASHADSDEMLATAKANIDDKFIVAGIVEQFDETLMLLKRRLGLRNIFYGVRNRTIDRPLRDQVPKDVVDLISERNRADIELYAYAKAKLATMIESEGALFPRDVRSFQRMNRPYSEMFRLVRTMKNKLVDMR